MGVTDVELNIISEIIPIKDKKIKKKSKSKNACNRINIYVKDKTKDAYNIILT